MVLYGTNPSGAQGPKLRFKLSSLITEASFSPLPRKLIVRRAVNFLEQVYDQVGRACVHRMIDKALVVPHPGSSSP